MTEFPVRVVKGDKADERMLEILDVVTGNRTCR